jgi:serine/threonine protein kinase
LKSALAPIVYGKYQLLERLARGGMAEVFKAKSHGVEGFEKILVIKRILPGLTENRQFVEMFINEAKIAVSLNHANVVQVFDLGYADGRYFIAMEYVAGCDLATLLERAPPGGLEPGLAVFVTGRSPRPSTTRTAAGTASGGPSGSCTVTSPRRTSSSASRAR